MPKTRRHGGGTNARETGRVVTRPAGAPRAARRAAAEEEQADGEAATIYGGWTVEQLRDELRERDLSPAGRKADLVERLLADDAEQHGAEQDDDPPDGGDAEDEPA